MANNYYLKNIFSVFFKDKISDKFDELSKNMIKSDRNLYKLYLDNKIEIDDLLERNGNSPLYIKNIVMSLNGGYINKLIELFNDDYIQNTDKQYLSSHNISKEQIEFVLKHKYEMRNADYIILDRLVSLDEMISPSISHYNDILDMFKRDKKIYGDIPSVITIENRRVSEASVDLVQTSNKKK